MEGEKKPTIKGIFVNSHIAAVRKVLGEDGVRKLEEIYGKPIIFKNSEDVPVREEVKIIECALDLLHPEMAISESRAFEAGRLHFQNFRTTPLAKIIFSVFRTDFKLMMLQSKNIAGHVFRGVHFTTEELSATKARVTMTNNDYPIDHFRGLFAEWMKFSGYEGTVSAEKVEPDTYQYLMEWK
jgi:uncharacterized protein (TIGR02265 family)